jgi:hypothetical protein
MQMKKARHLAMLTLAVLASACGGGSSTETAPAGPNTPTEAVSSMVTTVTPPTYSLGSEELAAFNRLNAERLRCGFGTLQQDRRLDLAALAHANWMLLNDVQSHFQDVNLTNGFTGVNPWDRAIAAGYPSITVTEIITFGITGSKVGRGDRGVRELLAVTYHAIGALRPMRDVGISVRAPSDVGVSTVLVPTEIVLGAADGFQLLASDAVVSYPCEGTTDVDAQHGWEEPNPVPGRNLQTQQLGHPIVIMVRHGQSLVLSSVSIQRVSDGVAVPMRPPVTGAADPNGRLANDPHIGYAIPDAPLLPNTAYRVSISGTNNGAAFQRTFTFTTGS